MSQQLHRSNQPLEVLIMYEPHRLHQQFLQAAYAFVVPVSRSCLNTAHRQGPVPENKDRSLESAQKGVRYE